MKDSNGRSYNERLEEGTTRKKQNSQQKLGIVIKLILVVEYLELYTKYGSNPRVTPEALEDSEGNIPEPLLTYFKIMSDEGALLQDKIDATNEAKKSVNEPAKLRQSMARSLKMESLFTGSPTEPIGTLEMVFLLAAKDSMRIYRTLELTNKSPLDQKSLTSLTRMFGSSVIWGLKSGTKNASSNEITVSHMNEAGKEVVSGDLDCELGILGRDAVTPTTTAASLFETGQLDTNLLHYDPTDEMVTDVAGAPSDKRQDSATTKRKNDGNNAESDAKKQKVEGSNDHTEDGNVAGNGDENQDSEPTVVTNTKTVSSDVSDSKHAEILLKCMAKVAGGSLTEAQMKEIANEYLKQTVNIKRNRRILKEDDNDDDDDDDDDDYDEIIDTDGEDEAVDEDDNNTEEDGHENNCDDDDGSGMEDDEEFKAIEQEEKDIEVLASKFLPGMKQGSGVTGGVDVILKLAYLRMTNKRRILGKDRKIFDDLQKSMTEGTNNHVYLRKSAEQLGVTIVLFKGTAATKTSGWTKTVFGRDEGETLTLVGIHPNQELPTGSNTKYRYYVTQEEA